MVKKERKKERKNTGYNESEKNIKNNEVCSSLGLY